MTWLTLVYLIPLQAFCINMSSLCTYNGHCHCGAVQFQVLAPQQLVVWRCNCSVCVMKQNHHFIVPASHFTLLSGTEALTEYRFNTKQAQHLFCSICGVQSFYRPRSNPDGYAVTIYCIDLPPTSSYSLQDYDGQNWEATYAVNDTIKTLSKEETYHPS